MNSIFKGLKVVELASVLAGPAVGTFFSELGADVIKIENKRTGGDVTRNWRQSGETESGPSAYYASINWNKKAVFADLTDPEDFNLVQDYIREADLVLSNFKKGDDEKFGLSFADLKKLNPTVIYGNISGFGSQSERVAYDLIVQAETGFMSINGQPESAPTKFPLAMIDLLAAHQLKQGILCAMLKQNKEPVKAFCVEVSLYDSAIASLINQATNWLMNENNPQRSGSLHPNIAPYGEVFTAKDGVLITVAIGSDAQFSALCEILGNEELANNNRFSTNSLRVENREDLQTILQQEIERFNGAVFLEKCHLLRIPAGEIKDIKRVFEEKSAQDLLLTDKQEGRKTNRPKTAVFKITVDE